MSKQTSVNDLVLKFRGELVPMPKTAEKDQALIATDALLKALTQPKMNDFLLQNALGDFEQTITLLRGGFGQLGGKRLKLSAEAISLLERVQNLNPKTRAHINVFGGPGFPW